MKRPFFAAVLTLLALPLVARGASALPSDMTTATVFIVNYDEDGRFRGWGSGFFVDEGIVVTNRHVIEAGEWYRVYATSDEKVNMDCYRRVTRDDVRLNLDDDVAYVRAYLPCDHGVLDFGQDPIEGDALSVLGYPYKGAVGTSTGLTVTTGIMLGRDEEGEWLLTDAHMDIGNSGGPVVNGRDALGVAVAKGVDADGNFAVGYFIPSSVILEGLLYANDPRFGYLPRGVASTSRSSARSSVGSSGSSFSSSSRSSSASSRPRSSSSSRRSSSAPDFPDVTRFLDGYEEIHRLRDRGVIGGYPDGTFRPGASMNRAEFIKILVAGFRSDRLRGETHCFSDVRDEWFATYVCAAERLGWIQGYPDGTFRPDQHINRAEAMKIVAIAFGAYVQDVATDLPSDVRGDVWFLPYVVSGVQIGIVDPDARFRAAEDLTREQGAIWIDGASR